MISIKDGTISMEGTRTQLCEEFAQIVHRLKQSVVSKDTILSLAIIGCMSDEELDKELKKQKELANE